MKAKPNIVLITLDSLRADFVGYQNSNENNTPFLDSFAKRSYIFTNAISQANPTFFCFGSIMTGTLPFAYGNFLGIPNNPNIKTLAEVMKCHGYSTYAYLADSPALYSEFGYSRGFDLYDDGYKNTNRLFLPLGEKLWKLRQMIPEAILEVLEPIRTYIKANLASPKPSISGKELNEKVSREFTKNARGPFFLWLHYMDAHLPFFSGLSKYFFKEEGSLERTIKKIIFLKELSNCIRNMYIKNPKLTYIFLEAYRSSIKYMDAALNEIINFLQNVYPNTIFILVADHGEAFMEHNFFGHEPYCLYNELIHVPLMIHLPSSEHKTIKQTVSLVSLAKTIAQTVGISEYQFQGNNLLKDKVYSPINNITRILYKCRSPHVRLGILDNNTEIEGYTTLWSFTTPKEKYIFEENGSIEEYYVLSRDPKETKNIIEDRKKTHAPIIRKLKKIIKDSKRKGPIFYK